MPQPIQIIGFEGLQEFLDDKIGKSKRWNNHMVAWLEREMPKIARSVNAVMRQDLPIATGTLRSRLTFKYYGWNDVRMTFDESKPPKIRPRNPKYQGAFNPQPSAYYKSNGSSKFRMYAEFLLGDGHLEKWRNNSQRFFLQLLRKSLYLQWRNYWKK
jgi:hypothetical protein